VNTDLGMRSTFCSNRVAGEAGTQGRARHIRRPRLLARPSGWDQTKYLPQPPREVSTRLSRHWRQKYCHLIFRIVSARHFGIRVMSSFTVTKGGQHDLHRSLKNMGTLLCAICSTRRQDIPDGSCIQFCILASKNLNYFKQR
jgi:hypothetical protein